MNSVALDFDPFIPYMPNNIASPRHILFLQTKVFHNTIKNIVRNLRVLLVDAKKFDFSSKDRSTDFEAGCQLSEVDITPWIHCFFEKCCVYMFPRSPWLCSSLNSNDLWYLDINRLSNYMVCELILINRHKKFTFHLLPFLPPVAVEKV